jgi:hypothetical protein
MFLLPIFASCALAAAPAAQQSNPPLPPPNEITARALANEKLTFDKLENYICRVHLDEDSLDSSGHVKKTASREMEEFFVNGNEIDHLLSKNGKPLSEYDSQREQQRVDDAVRKYSNPKEKTKVESLQEKQIEAALRVLNFSNERRATIDGRSAIFFDLSGNASTPAHNLDERFMQAMVGTVALDEKTGEMIDLNVHSIRDVKVAGGLLANLHKGFSLHVHQIQESDGVWITNLTEGSGDARAGIFMHPYFRFRQTQDHCGVFSVSTTQSAPPKKP